MNAMYEQFKSIEAVISATEMAAQKRIEEATEAAEIFATVDGLSWPTPEQLGS
jgi:hypothetical protein